jgi:riboflavin biosynthesis pyrimidine reductase
MANGDVMEPLELLYETPGLPAFPLPDELARLYGGTLGFEEPRVFANFVQTIDGVTAIPSVAGSNKLIAGGSAADRFVMAVLRAVADVVVVGSGTLEASPRGAWTAARAFPDAGDQLAALRRRIGRDGDPELVVLSRSGRVDTNHPAFASGAVVFTTDEGAGRLALPPERIVVAEDVLNGSTILALVHERGHALVLSEGGPSAWGPLLAERLVDELFLTVSPLLTGRIDDDPRLGLVEGADLLDGGEPLAAEILGIRRDGDHLFLRYLLDTTPRVNPDAEVEPGT